LPKTVQFPGRGRAFGKHFFVMAPSFGESLRGCGRLPSNMMGKPTTRGSLPGSVRNRSAAASVRIGLTNVEMCH
jgi:hypothetical protein